MPNPFNRSAFSAHVGKLGERVSVEGPIMYFAVRQGLKGPYYITRILTPAGEFVYLGELVLGRVGDKVKLTAKIKAHEEYNGYKSTRIFRIRVDKLK